VHYSFCRNLPSLGEGARAGGFMMGVRLSRRKRLLALLGTILARVVTFLVCGFFGLLVLVILPSLARDMGAHSR